MYWGYFWHFLATLLISQQSAIFLGLTSRSYRLVTDISAPNIWVIDPSTESDIKVRGIPEGYIDVVRSISGVEWAVPVNVMDIPLVTQSGIFDVCQLYGIDDSTLIGAPTEILEGNLMNLHREGGVLVDVYSATDRLQKLYPMGTKVPLALNDTLEINDHRAIVVGICKVTQGFYPQPIVFTTNNNFKYFTSRNTIDFIAAKTKDGASVEDVLQKIKAHSILEGLTQDQLKWRMANRS